VVTYHHIGDGGGNHAALVDSHFSRFEGALIEKLGNPTSRSPVINVPWKPAWD